MKKQAIIMGQFFPRHRLLLLASLILLMSQLPSLASGLTATVDEAKRVVVDLLVIGLVALITAALLSPLETLGWWAGWYGDRVETDVTAVTPTQPLPSSSVSRYIVYLDGIGKFQATYSPEVETLLKTLDQALPDMAIVRDIMPYSVLNRTVTVPSDAVVESKKVVPVLSLLLNTLARGNRECSYLEL